METFEVYIEAYIEEYIEQYIQNLREQMDQSEGDDIDRVKALSLLRSSVEIENPELPKASVLIVDQENSAKVYSVSLKNVHFNLSFSLDMLLGISAISEGESRDIKTLLLVLKFISDCFNRSVMKLNLCSAFVLNILFQREKNRKISIEEDLIREFLENKSLGQDAEEVKKKVREALNELQMLRCIQCVDGKYQICEKVFSKNN
ncbi:MAG: hypothetical protein R3Y06_09550 [Faecalibacterium sp.]